MMLEAGGMSIAYSREDTLELIRRVEDIPTLPDVFFRLKKVIEDPTSDSKALARVIGTDQATTSRLLKVANSAAFNPAGRPISRLEQAITRVGVNETGNIAMAMSLFYGLVLRGSVQNIQLFWIHAYAVGVLSKQMAGALGLAAEEIFIAGLLHDIGRAILGLRVDMSYFENETSRLSGDLLIEREVACYGLDHAVAGAEIMEAWHFPAALIKAVREHHKPDSDFLPARIVSLANREVHAHLSRIADLEQVHSALSKQFPAGVSALLQSEGFVSN